MGMIMGFGSKQVVTAVSMAPYIIPEVPLMWEDLIPKAIEGGIDVIGTYVFWNVHEPSPSNNSVQFQIFRYDLVRFVKTIQKAGLYVVIICFLIFWSPHSCSLIHEQQYFMNGTLLRFYVNSDSEMIIYVNLMSVILSSPPIHAQDMC
ncbi:hypothetical protein Ahy_B04g069764 isoform B [Arachis hypogaea]|uniref:beta-galactosidase n=1 Tax=Arachis hypogaea TaxID=3818 RepID=A0A444ZDI1_ARAHY|nr:hypothetical protein Ahy_B04g069764 isoform B [Arachis hypogaea]